jgi:hypothetical protein
MLNTVGAVVGFFFMNLLSRHIRFSIS